MNNRMRFASLSVPLLSLLTTISTANGTGSRCEVAVPAAAVHRATERLEYLVTTKNLNPARVTIEFGRAELQLTSDNVETWRVTYRLKADDVVLKPIELMRFNRKCQLLTEPAQVSASEVDEIESGLD